MAIMEASATRLQSYWRATRAPRYSLLFALPLLVFYEILAVLVAAGPGSSSGTGPTSCSAPPSSRSWACAARSCSK